MANENQKDRAFLNTSHEQRITIADIDVTGRVVKWAICAIDAATGSFDPTLPVLEKTTATGGITIFAAAAAESTVDVLLMPADTVSLDAGNYHFQCEVFDGSGLNGVVVSTGKLTLVPNITETV